MSAAVLSGRGATRQRGFSIIELMIGLVMGMFAVLIILQLLSTTTAQQRLASTSGDAEINGATATHVLVRELTQAGLGISAYTLLGCSLSYTATADGAAVTLPALAPVTINPGSAVIPAGDANTDTLLVVSGSSASPSEGDAITAVSTSSTYVVSTPASFSTGDRIVAAPSIRDTSATCALTLGSVTGVSGYALAVTAGTGSLPVGSAVYNFGDSPAIHAYAIRNGNLTQCDYLVYDCGSTSYTTTLDSNVWVPVASQISSLRAQYARDTTDFVTPRMDGIVDRYDQVTPGSSADTSGQPNYCSWLRVVGLRTVMVARAQQYDKGTPTTAAPAWSGGVANGSVSSTLSTVTPTALPIDLSTDTDWQHYRYKTIETTVPLRDVIWNGNQVGYQNGNVRC